MPLAGPCKDRVGSLGAARLLGHFAERTHIPEVLRRHLSDPFVLRNLVLLHILLQAREPLYALPA